MMLFELGWQLLVILLLVCANGFFVAAEFAIVKIRASQLKPLLKTGDWRFPWRCARSTIWMPAFQPLSLGLLLPAWAWAGWGAVLGSLAAAGV